MKQFFLSFKRVQFLKIKNEHGLKLHFKPAIDTDQIMFQSLTHIVVHVFLNMRVQLSARDNAFT